MSFLANFDCGVENHGVDQPRARDGLYGQIYAVLCSRMTATTTTLFFTVANKRYEPFVLPYIFSVLAHNCDAYVEILLEEPRRFEQENADALDYLIENYGGGRFRLTRETSVVPALTRYGS